MVVHSLMSIRLKQNGVAELPIGTLIYGPLHCDDESATILVDGKLHRCHLDEFLEYSENVKAQRKKRTRGAARR